MMFFMIRERFYQKIMHMGTMFRGFDVNMESWGGEAGCSYLPYGGISIPTVHLYAFYNSTISSVLNISSIVSLRRIKWVLPFHIKTSGGRNRAL